MFVCSYRLTPPPLPPPPTFPKMVSEGEIVPNTIVELKKFVSNEAGGKKMLIVLDLSIVQKDCELIGAPAPLGAVPAPAPAARAPRATTFGFWVSKRVLNGSEPSMSGAGFNGVGLLTNTEWELHKRLISLRSVLVREAWFRKIRYHSD